MRFFVTAPHPGLFTSFRMTGERGHLMADNKVDKQSGHTYTCIKEDSIMKKRQWFQGLSLLSFIAIVSLCAACITVTEKTETSPDSPGVKPTLAPPTVNSFVANATSVTQGDSVTLSWDVSLAAQVTISPAIGTVSLTGSQSVTPDENTTYVLTATNQAGESISRVTISVNPPAATAPDLVITDIWIKVDNVYYKIMNQGTTQSRGSRAYLYVDGLYMDNHYSETLVPGEERTEMFGKYKWVYKIDTGVANISYEDAPTQYEIRVCADDKSDIIESNEDNNCKGIIWGEEFVYDFAKMAHMATWSTETSVLKWPVASGSLSGAMFVQNMTLEDGKGYAPVVATYPPKSGGWIQGKFGAFYTDTTSRELKSKPIYIPPKAKFVADVGFKKNATEASGVKFVLGIGEVSGNVEFTTGIEAVYDEELDRYEVDLSHLAGEKRYFILRVEAQNASDQNWAVWSDPRLIQEW